MLKKIKKIIICCFVITLLSSSILKKDDVFTKGCKQHFTQTENDRPRQGDKSTSPIY